MAYASRKDFQLSRKLLHLFNGSLGFWLYVYSGLSKTLVLSILAFCVFISACSDLLRAKNPTFKKWMSQKVSSMIREQELQGLSSMSKGLGCTLLVLLVFSEKVGILIMLYATYADVAAGIVGSLFGKIRLNAHASLEGSLAFFVTAFLSGLYAFHFLFFPAMSLTFAMILFSALSALLVTLIEAFFPQYDDNILIPLLGAPVLALLFLLWKF